MDSNMFLHPDEYIMQADYRSSKSSFQHAAAATASRINDTTDTAVPKVTLMSLVMALFVSMGGLLFGYDTGQISGFLEMDDFLHRFGELDATKGEYSFSNVRSGLIVGLLSIGTLIGSLVAAPIADFLGRKYTISLCCLILNIGLIVQISSPAGHWYQIVIGRWVTGLGVGGCSLVVPMYQGESAPRHIRGAMISCYQLFVTLGIFLAYCINLGSHTIRSEEETLTLEASAQWRVTLGITFVFAVVLGIGMHFFPETPRYEYRHGKVDSARKTLSRLYGVPENHSVLTKEMDNIREQFESETEGQKWHEFITAPRMLYRIALGMTLQMLQQLTGSNYFFYYGTTIFKGAGMSDSFITQCILGAVNFGCTFGGIYIVENFGRRRALMIGGSIMFVMFMIFASLGHFMLDIHEPQNTPNIGKGMIIVTCIFLAAYAMTWAPMAWAIVAEIFPSKYRAKGMALSTASNWLWNFLLSFFTPFITHDIDFAYGYVFAGCLFAGVLVTYFFVIEGRGRTLEEIDWMYVNNVAPCKSSKFEVPKSEKTCHQMRTSKQLELNHAENV